VPVAMPWNMVMTLRLFIGSLWLTVATTLLCAVLPTGLPETSSVGSAFNPSTTSVALHSARPESRAARAEAVRPRDPEVGAPSVVAILPAAFSAALFIILVVAWRPGRVDGLVPFRLRGAAYPRGPPSR